jgi:hypothetical protein
MPAFNPLMIVVGGLVYAVLVVLIVVAFVG